MIHIHARRPDGTPSYEVEDFQAISDAILAEVGDVIVNFSTGALGVPIDKRVAYLRACRPDVAALNMGSMNYAKYSARRKEFVFQTVFANPFDEIIALLEAMNELGIKPEHECFDVGHVGSLAPLVDMGVLHPPLHVSCVMGVTGGIPPTARNLALMADNVPAGSHWGVIGISRAQWMLVAASLTLGGSVRVGLEDNFYLPDGTMARSNGELIAKARQLTEDVGRRPATRSGGARDPRGPAEGRGLTALPLDGVRVLDLSRLLPGGFCSLMLADFGADVLKVEDTGLGDYVRWATPYYEGVEDSAKSALFLVAQSRQALDPAEPQERRGPRGAAAPGRRVRRRARVVSPGRARPPRRRLRGHARGQPGDRLLRDHGLRPGRPVARSVGPRHELPRARRAARPDRRRRWAARAGGRPDRRPGRRRIDGGLRDPRRAARARPLGRGPGRRRVDGRRRPVVARHGRGPLPGRGRGAAPRRPRARRVARLLSALRVRRRVGHARRPGAEVLAGVVPGRRARGSRRAPVRAGGQRGAPRGRGHVPRAHARGVARLRLRARLLPGAGARPRRGARVGAHPRARDGGGARPAGGAAAGPAARRAGEAEPHPRRRQPRARARAGRAHERGARGARLRPGGDRRAARSRVPPRVRRPEPRGRSSS